MALNPTLLFTPGPTRIPPQVQEELSKPMIHHRSDEFVKIFSSLRNNLHLLSQTDGESVVLTSSGTGAMESVIASMFSNGDHVVVVDAGKFGKRWVQLCKRYNLNVSVIQKPWGYAVTVEEVLAQIKPSTKAVMVQACESSTGVYHPIEALGAALDKYPQLLFVVDAITAFGIYPHSQRTHHIDVLIAASQKALMCPPGLSVVCLSKRALSAVHPTEMMYLSLENELKAQVKGNAAFTPAISLVRGMERSTEMILNEGRQQVFERHKRLQMITRGFFRALGFHLLVSDPESSAGITSVHTISGLDIEKWLENLRQEYGLWFASGQELYKDKIFRVAHMGYCHENSLIPALHMVADSLKKILPIDQATEFLKKY